jgi:hypothetical protein
MELHAAPSPSQRRAAQRKEFLERATMPRMQRRSQGSARSLLLLAAASAAALAAAAAAGLAPRPAAAAPLPGGDDVKSIPATLPPIEDPRDRVTHLEDVEDYSEDVANMFVEWGEKLRLRNFAGARSLFTDDFLGHDLARPGTPTTKTFDLGITKTTWDAKDLRVVNRTGFMESWRDFLSPLGTIEFLFVKVRGAEFAQGTPVEGALTVRVNAIGVASGGGRIGREGYGRVHIEKAAGKWQVDRWTVTSLTDIARPQSIFTEVGRAVGVAQRGPQFGKDGNTSFFWQGAAVSDYDGDGLQDVFVPSQHQNFLYRNLGNGTFVDVAAEAGVAQPPGGTGCVFFDGDNDGDLDLFVAHAGFKDGGEVIGRPCQYYENAGKGRFENASAAAGFTDLLCGMSVAVADADNDGWLDLFVCGYQTGGFTGPDSFYDANNGTRNALYVNRGDGTFVDRAAEIGFPANRWTYAAAWHDFDEDGDQDLFVANDYGTKELWRNDGNLKFKDVAAERGVTDVGNGMGCAFGDFDADGDVDLYASNMSSSAGNRILTRLVAPDSKDDKERTLKKLAGGNTLFSFQDGKFAAVPAKFGGVGASWAWGPQFMDLDLDGDLDLACANGFISGNSLKDT